MVEIGAIGSVRYITAVDAGNTGTDGARRSVVVTELTPDNSKPTNKKYNVLVLESMKDKIGVLKVAGFPLLREGESLNKNRILNIASSLATQLRNKQTANIVELDRPYMLLFLRLYLSQSMLLLLTQSFMGNGL